MRKTFTGLGLGALLSAGLAISVATTAPTAAFADDTVKIGVLLIDSGPLAGLKETQVKAVNLAIEQINAAGGAAGKKLEAVFISYPDTPDTAVDGATRAVQKDGAMFITGMSTSSVSPALQAKLPALKVLMLEVMANADGLTGKGVLTELFPGQRKRIDDYGFVPAVLKDQGIKKWDIIAVDYAAGRDSADKFKALIASQGGVNRQDAVRPVRNAGFRRQDFGSRKSGTG